MKTTNPRIWLTRGVQVVLMTGLVWGAAGCEEDDFVDVTPPAVPTGVFSDTGDGEVILYWIPNREADLAGYHVLSNNDGGAAYTIIATIDADDPDYYAAGAGLGDDLMYFPDTGLQNRMEYWYAVIAFDHAGNESELSYEYVYDVPRPQGQVILSDRFTSPQFSGFDFSDGTNARVAWNSPFADAYLEVDGAGVPYLVSADPLVRLQDYGNVHFDDASFAPADGWSRTGRVEAIEGHSYIFEIAANGDNNAPVNYAKLWIFALAADSADMDWGYQEVVNEPQLKLPGGRTSPDGISGPKEQLP